MQLHLPVIPALSAAQFKKAVGKKAAVLIDTRNMFAFGGGHIEGALNIGGTPSAHDLGGLAARKRHPNYWREPI